MYLNFKTSFSGILGIALATFGTNVQAEVQPDRLDWVQSDQQLCGGYYLAPDLPEGGQDLEARADNSIYDGRDRVALTGNAALWNQQISLEADEISLFRVSGDGDAIGNVALREPRFLIRGDAASLNIYSGRVELYNTDIVAHRLHLYGNASQVTRDGQGVIRVEDVIYTKCSPSQREWQIGSSFLELNRETGRGYARNVTLRAGGIPFVWLPVIGFPVDERRLTGFLWPTLKSESNSTDGDDISFSAPFYWNQRPQSDMLITPKRVAFRGNGLDLRQRHLFEDESRLTLNLGLLPDDDKTKTDREAAELIWQSKSGQTWAANAYAGYASDAKYNDDIGGDASVDDEDFPSIRANATRRLADQQLDIKTYSYYVANRAKAFSDRPYRELPRINWRVNPRDQAWSTRLEAVHFDRDVSGLTGDAAVTGSRVFGSANWVAPKRASWGFAEAKVGVDAVTYQLDRASTDSRDDAPSALVPRAGLDAGLTLEKSFNTLTHRIEPRIKYLYADYTDQSDQPNFDTGAIGFSFTQLFNDQRFSGGDRIGDTEQVSLGLSNKVVRDSDGTERVRFDIGQTFYLSDRRVNLTDTVDQTERSPLVSEGRIKFSDFWSASAETTYADDMGIESGAVGLKYRQNSDTLATLRTRFNENSVTTYEASALWGINERWRVGGGFAYSRPLNRTQRFAWGFEYESCCWRASLVQNYDRPDTAGSNGTHSVTLQIQLKGLGMGGRKAITNLEDNIEDFEPRPVRF